MSISVDLGKVQNYLEWLKTKLFLDSKAVAAKNRSVKRGQVYSCDLGVGIGSEMQKKRPCVIVQGDIANQSSPNTIVIPITHDPSTLPTVVPITSITDNNGNIILDGNANASCMVCVIKARLGDLIGRLSNSDMKMIDQSIAKSVNLMHYYAKLQSQIQTKDAYIQKIKLSRNIAQDKLRDIQNTIESLDSTEEMIEKIKNIIKTT